MNSKRKDIQGALTNGGKHGRVVAPPEQGQCLDTGQLTRLEQSFREWADSATRKDIRFSRYRILLIFLLIRHSGGKLNEILSLNLPNDIDLEQQYVRFGSGEPRDTREVQISNAVCQELRRMLAAPLLARGPHNLLAVDPAFVRRKFYERAQACGYSRRSGSPEMIRKARAVELMQGNMPLPAVQMMLGHSTPTLTSSYVTFSEADIRHVTRLYLERESSRKTSARNAFFGKITKIRRGDIQAGVTLSTLEGCAVTTVITNDSLDRLGLAPGGLVTAEIKAPWVILQKGEDEPACSAENRYQGEITRISRGKINTEYTLRIADGTELSSVILTESGRALELEVGDRAWALFNCHAVILRVD
jgi:molybdate transport system regulatory protein